MRRDDLSVQLPAILLYLCSTNSRIGAPNNHVTPYEKALWRQEVTSSSTRLRGGHQPRPVWVRGGRRDILNVRRAKVKTRRVTLTIGKSANGELRPITATTKMTPLFIHLQCQGHDLIFTRCVVCSAEILFGASTRVRLPVWKQSTHQLCNPRWQQWGFNTPRLSPCHLLLIKANSWLWLNDSR